MIPSFGIARLPSSTLGSPLGTPRFEEAPGEFTEALLPLRFQSCHCVSSFSSSLFLSLSVFFSPRFRACSLLARHSRFLATRLYDDVRQRSPVIEGFFEDQRRVPAARGDPIPAITYVFTFSFIRTSSRRDDRVSEVVPSMFWSKVRCRCVTCRKPRRIFQRIALPFSSRTSEQFVRAHPWNECAESERSGRRENSVCVCQRS